LEFVYFEFDAFVLLDPYGINLDGLNILLLDFFSSYMQIWAKSGRGQDLGLCVGFTNREGGRAGRGQTEDNRQVIVPKGQFGTQFDP
jgi:hypothetical protein